MSIRICNIYSAPVFGEEGPRVRPMEKGNWDEILESSGDRCIIAGDFNSHSKRWDRGENVKEGGGSARWLKQLIDDHDLEIYSSGEATYHKDNSAYSSVIDLVLAQRAVRISGWRIEDRDEAATTSDHEVISWEVDMGTAEAEEEEGATYGWKIGEFLKDGGKVEEARLFWRGLMDHIPALEKGVSRTQIEEWTSHLQSSTFSTLDRFAGRMRICPRTKTRGV